jgi:hypothetical protein
MLRQTMASCAGDRCSAYDVSRALYPGRQRGIDPVLALGGSHAHLHHLVRAGELESALDESGVRRYRGYRARAATERGEHG